MQRHGHTHLICRPPSADVLGRRDFRSDGLEHIGTPQTRFEVRLLADRIEPSNCGESLCNRPRLATSGERHRVYRINCIGRIEHMCYFTGCG